MSATNQISDLPTERALLCGLVQNGKEAFIDVQDIIGPNSFTEHSNSVIYNCLAVMYDESYDYDMPSFLSAASSLGLTEVVDTPQQLDYLKSLSQMRVSIDNVRKHAVKLSKLSLIRRLQDAAKETYKHLSTLNGSESVDSIMSAAEKSIFDATMEIQGGSEQFVELIGDDIMSYIEWLEETQCDEIGIPTPYPRWSLTTGGGFRRGTTTLFGARPKTGKTTIAKDIAFHAAVNNIPVLVLDTEMNNKDQRNKLLASMTGVPIKEIETGTFSKSSIKRNNVIKAAKRLESMPYYYKSICGKGFEDVLSVIRRWIFQHVGFDQDGNTKDCLVIYDYFKLQEAAKLESVQEYQALGFQIADMTNFCIQYDIPTVAFVQLNREGIDKETTAAISQSDRLLWLCSSFTMIKRKLEEEIQADGERNGNMKFIPLEARFGPGLKDKDYINVHVQGNTAAVQELNFKSDIVKRNKEDGDDSGKIAD